MTAAAPILEMAGVSKHFTTPRGPVRVLQSVDLTIGAGEFVAVTGPSGSGKTTFLTLAGLLDVPTAGQVRFEGRDTSTLSEDDLCAVRKRGIGVVFQKYCLLPHRSVLDNVVFRFRYLDKPLTEARDLASRTLEALGIAGLAAQPARLLSGGEMQRVAIARAVVLRPSLLLADEPTGNLDRLAAESVMATFRQLNREGITIVMATHNESLLAYCSRRLVCRDGGLQSETL